jgi:hypothetical protein
MAFTACGGEGSRGTPLQTEEVQDDGDLVLGPDTGVGSGNGENADLHPLFNEIPGYVISRSAMGAVDPDPSGYTICDDYDGDGIPNDEEIVTNPAVADYPRIVARIAPEVVMEIKIDRTQTEESYIEFSENDDFRETISDSMEDRHYSQFNQKTTPYVVKESSSESGNYSESYGYDNEDEYKFKAKMSVDVAIFGGEQEISGEEKTRRSENWAMAEAFSSSNMSEKTVFDKVDYWDNLDRGGIAFTDDKVRAMARNFRNNTKLKETGVTGPNAGVVSASLYLKNTTVNMPVKISNVTCSLSFRTPGGEYIGVSTFKLLNDDFSDFEQEIYGDSEAGPFVIVVRDLDTEKVKRALANGYSPQIHVVNYDMHRVEDSNYNPGTNNLRIVEETAKGRTAQIKIIGNGVRELYRVSAFDVAGGGDSGNGELSAGISLKKALFNILRKRAGNRETWNDEVLTVDDDGLRWKTGSENHDFRTGVNGNAWEMFETTVKTSVDSYNNERKIEVIKRIGQLQQYNPFNPEDNPAFNPNELLGESEINKMKYWVILHNGRYFTGDINDPIWAGERYEIICMDVGDFNRHFRSFTYTPLQSGERFDINTRWNELANEKEFSRSLYMGKLFSGEVVHLEVDLLESRFLFGKNAVVKGETVSDDMISVGDIPYQIQGNDEAETGIPGVFTHEANGGNNSVRVRIVPSKSAEKYRITISGVQGDTYRREIDITAESLNDENGEVVICSRTEDVNGIALGHIAGSAGIGRTYRIDATALGTYMGCPVETPSSSSGVLAFVFEAEGTPSPFSFSAMGSGESVYVRNGESSGAEYYRVVCEGPLNSGLQSMTTVQEFTGKAGLNIIRPLLPDANIKDPLLYRVTVYAHNKNTGQGGVCAGNRYQFITLAGELYREQRKNQGRMSDDFFQAGAVDLEVNFNDGSGWYRLRLEYNDTKNTERFIDCRYSSNVEYDKQKFHIYFKAPNGSDGDHFNVFRGGRDEVDLYIRTAPDAKYRDTFWPSNSDNGPDCDTCPLSNPPVMVKTMSDGANSFDLLSFWINNPHTDATRIEETLSEKSGEDYSGLDEDDFMLKSGSIEDYFFSPLEKRIYSLRASLESTLPGPGGQLIAAPVFSISRGNESVSVLNMDSPMADYYEIYYRAWEHDGHNSENPAGNAFWKCFYASDPSLDRQIIGDLVPNQKYVVAVRACNEHIGRSGWAFSEPVMPFSRDIPPAPQGLIVHTRMENGTWVLDVANIYVPGQVSYQVGYRRASQPVDSLVITEPLIETEYGIAAGPVSLGPLVPWERYLVRARAVQLSGVAGDWSQDIAVDVPGDGSFTVEALWTGKTDNGRREVFDFYSRYGYQCNTGCCDYEKRFYDYVLTLANVTGPENLEEYRVEGSIEYDESTNRSAFLNPVRRSVPVSVDWTDEDEIDILGPVENRFEKYNLVRLSQMCSAGYLIQNTQLHLVVTGRNSYGEEVSSDTLIIDVPDPE